MFLIAQFTIGKLWKKIPDALQLRMDQENVVYTLECYLSIGIMTPYSLKVKDVIGGLHVK
jgi:hypothetical protein